MEIPFGPLVEIQGKVKDVGSSNRRIPIRFITIDTPALVNGFDPVHGRVMLSYDSMTPVPNISLDSCNTVRT